MNTHTHTHNGAYYKELDHIIVEADESQDLQEELAAGDPKKLMV